MSGLLRALAALLVIETLQATGRFDRLHTTVNRKRTARPSKSAAPGRIVNVFRIAVALYPKRVLCLQRSAALVLLLRDNGFPANLVIGASSLPFGAHAWVELSDCVLDENAEVRKRYVVVDRW